eukprot:9742472-Alexandrium_andersonii.AAC.1
MGARGPWAAAPNTGSSTRGHRPAQRNITRAVCLAQFRGWLQLPSWAAPRLCAGNLGPRPVAPY